LGSSAATAREVKGRHCRKNTYPQKGDGIRQKGGNLLAFSMDKKKSERRVQLLRERTQEKLGKDSNSR